MPIETLIRSVIPLGKGDERHFRPAPDPFGDCTGGRVVHRGQDERELLATVTGGEVVVPQARAQDVGERPERLIPGGVPVPIVEVLEVVQVEHQHGDGLVLAPGDEQG